MYPRQSRQIKLLIILLIFCFTLTGCGKSQPENNGLDPKNPIAIKIWHYYNGAQKVAFDQLVEEFNNTLGREKGIIVEAFSQGSVDGLTENIMAAAEKKVGAETLPDIFAAYADTAFAIDQMNLTADLSGYLTDEELSSYIDSYIAEGQLNDDHQLKIFPIAKSTEVLLVNQTDWDKFALATGASANAFLTVEGVTKVAGEYYHWTDSLTPAPNDGKAFFGRDALANYMIIGSKQLGSEIFSVQNGQVMLTLDKDVFRKLWDNYYVPMLQGYFAASSRFRSDDAKIGNIIALVGSTSGAAYFPDQVTIDDQVAYPIDLAVFQVPCFAGGQPYAVQQGAGMVVAKSDQQREYASTVFLKWFTDPERNLVFSVSSGYLPVKKAANNADLLAKQLSESTGLVDSKQLRATLPVAMNQVNTRPLYTTKAFAQGTTARDILENALPDQLAVDFAMIETAMAAGQTRQQAIQPFLTDAHFEQWFAQLNSALEAILQKK